MATAAGPRPPATEAVLDRPLALLLGRSKPVVALGRREIKRVRDLLFHLPRRYDDFSRPMTLRQLRERPPEGPVSATVEVVSLDVQPGFRRRVQRTVARLRDATGEGEAVWFGRRYVERRLAAGMTVALSGKVELRGWLPRFVSPEFGEVGAEALHAGRIVPIYRLTGGVTLPWLRRSIRRALDAVAADYPDYLPSAARRAKSLPEIAQAIEWVHFPPSFESLDAALGRLAFDELLALQLGMVGQQRRRQHEHSRSIQVDDERWTQALSTVEATIAAQVARRRQAAGADHGDAPEVRLTIDQREALDDIRTDLAADRPMLRLLQGDVGSGKTAVAALAMYAVAVAGRQAALLAPTDLLARQHAATLADLLGPLGYEVTLLTGSLEAARRREALELIAAPPTSALDGVERGHIIVGTHALVQQRVVFHDLCLVIVDEQHRFGVAEREALTAKGSAPHLLLMTATPIPRTLAQVVHADLDVSDLRTPPAGRMPVFTGVRNSSELISWTDKDGNTHKGALPRLVRELAAGQRAFVIVPRVEEDDESDARSVEEAAQLIREQWPMAAELEGSQAPPPPMVVVHGQLPAAERDARMEAFRQGDVALVVGTTVLEVGVDVPEATVMLILDADRFGLAQLHQLRGRVGRGEARSYCVLVSDRYPREAAAPTNDEEAAVKVRLEALETRPDGSQLDGFELAEVDLEQRREGELLGLHQSGLPPFRVASLQRPQHVELSLAARQLAEALIDDEGRLRAGHDLLEAELKDGWLRSLGASEVVLAGDDE